MNNYFLKPIKYKNDENNSFQYFRSFITFYYCLLFFNKKSNDAKKLFTQLYPEKYYNLFYKQFIISQNPLIFTYFNNIPSIFYPYFEELYYYYPIITFYNSGKFYKKGFIHFSKLNYYQENVKISKKEIQISIPINFILKYKFPQNYYILIKTNSNIYSSSNVIINKDTITLNNCKIKSKIYKNTSNVNLNINEIQLAYVLIPITKEKILDSFQENIIKKDSWLYYVKSNYDKRKQMFYTLYPKINMLNLGFEGNTKWYCVRNKLVKDLKVLNLTVDIFYNNEIVNRYYNNKFMDYRNNNNILEDDIFRCIQNDDEMKKRKDICNYNIMLPYGNRTFVKNKGKKMINLLAYKNLFFADYRNYYYAFLLEKFDINAFVYHYGYILEKNKEKFFDMELGFVNEKILDEYVKKIDEVDGDCPILYKK